MSKARAAASSAGASGVTRATVTSDELAIGLLAQSLLDPARRRPVVLVMIDAGQHQPYVSVPELERQVRGRADIVVVPHPLSRS